MSSKSVGVVIGRFQPVHSGHIKLIELANSSVDEVIILVGSSNIPRSIKNPWTFEERRLNLENHLKTNGFSAIIAPVNDYPLDDEMWCHDVKDTVANLCGGSDDITLFGYIKDGNDYLKWFPEWGFKVLAPIVPEIHATDIRQSMLERNDPAMPPEVQALYDYHIPVAVNDARAHLLFEVSGQFVFVENRHYPSTYRLPTLDDVPPAVISDTLLVSEYHSVGWSQYVAHFSCPSMAKFTSLWNDHQKLPPMFTLSEIYGNLNKYDPVSRNIVSKLTNTRPLSAFKLMQE